jgi:hypothetical protein
MHAAVWAGLRSLRFARRLWRGNVSLLTVVTEGCNVERMIAIHGAATGIVQTDLDDMQIRGLRNRNAEISMQQNKNNSKTFRYEQIVYLDLCLMGMTDFSAYSRH